MLSKVFVYHKKLGICVMTEYPDYISDFLQSGLSYTITIVLCETLGGVFSLKTSLCTFYMVLSELYLS